MRNFLLLLFTVTSLAHTVSAHERTGDSYYSEATALYKRGNFGAAIEKCKLVLNYEKRADAYFLMALSLMKEGKHAEAIKCLDSIRANVRLKHPVAPELVHFAFGKCHMAMDNIEQAIQSFSEAARSAPRDHRYLEALAGAYEKAGKTKDAAEARDKAKKILAAKPASQKSK